MNSRKSKDRAKPHDVQRNHHRATHYEDHKNYSSPNKPYSYDMSQATQNNMQKDRNSLKLHNRNSQSQSKQNEAIFKNIQKCNQKMEYYKLVGSLQEQKRTILEQQNHLLKQENQQLKSQLHARQKQAKRLQKKLQKYAKQLNKHQLINSKQDNFIIDLPRKNKPNKSYPNPDQFNQDSSCPKCAYLEQQLMEERTLYQKDRNYLKEQVDNLAESLSDAKKQFKTVNKELSGMSAFYDKKIEDMGGKFRQAENQLKQELTICYRSLEDKCDFIGELQLKIDFFQQENHRIIQLLNILDGASPQSHGLNKTLPFSLQKPDRSKSAYNVKEKPPRHPNFFNSNQNSIQQDPNVIDNRRKARKCGSIKKIDVD